MARLIGLYILLIAIAVVPVMAIGQAIDEGINSRSRYNHMIGGSIEFGKVMPTNEYLRGDYEGGEEVKRFGSASFQYGWQTNGDQLWHHLYGNPGWGFGMLHADFGRPEDLGAPWAIFGYYEGPVKRWRKVSINYHYRVGVSTGWKPFDAQENPYQISLGSSRALYANLKFYLLYRITSLIDLYGGISFSHYSNGSTVKPNKGINMIAPFIGLSFKYTAIPEVKAPVVIPKYQDNWEWLTALTLGQKQVVFDTTGAQREIDRRYVGLNYKLVGITSTLFRQVSYKSKFGLGVDFLYDESINANFDIENGTIVQQSNKFSDNVAIGIYPAYELVMNRLSFLVQGGIYVLRENRPNQAPLFYQRVGLKYHILRNVFVGVNVKAWNMKVADFIEWNLGYRIAWH